MKMVEYYRKMLNSPEPIFARDLAKSLRTGSIQSIKIIVVAKTGGGKSYLSGGLLEDFARWSSIIDHDDLNHVHNYFAPDMEHVATIDPTEIQNLLLNSTKKYNGYLVDDIGFAWSNRQWQSKKNLVMNAWLGIQRTNRNLLVFTIVSDKFWDSQARSFVDMYIEVSGPQMFGKNTNFAKVFYTSLHPRSKTDPIHYQYPVHDGSSYRIFAFGKPGDEFRTFYDPIRAKRVEEFTAKEFAAVVEAAEGESPKKKEKKDDGKTRCPECRSAQVRFLKKKGCFICNKCGSEF